MSVGSLTRDDRRPLPRVDAQRSRAVLTSPAVVTLGALIVLAAVLRLYRIGHQGFWFDEANTALLVHFSPGKMIGLIPQTETTPPLYYCIAWVWARVFDYGETPLRALSALAGVLTVPVAYAAGMKLISRRAGVVAAALTACNPLLIWYSQEARSYSLLVLLTAMSLLAFAYVCSDPSPRTVAAWVIASALALATHYYALLVIVPEALWLLAIHRRVRPVQVGIAVVGACGLALIPLAIGQNGTGHASWIAPIPLGPRLDQIFPQFLIGLGAPARELLYVISALGVLAALVLLALRSDPRERRAGFALGALALGGLVLNLVLVAVGIDDLITRNVIALWLPAALMVAAGLGARRAGLAGVGVAVVLCATGLVAAAGVAADRNLQRPDWRGVARVLGAKPAPTVGPRAILVQDYRDLLPLSLYLPGLKFWTGPGPRALTELDIVSISAPRVPLCWWGAACNLSPSRMQRAYAIPGFHELWVRKAYQFSIMRLVSDRPVVLTPRMVSQALHATTLPRDQLLYQRG